MAECKENTEKEVKERRGLLVNRSKWKRLQDVITMKQRLLAMAQERAQLLKERKQLSAEMQSQWENTYLNMRKKRLEEIETKKALIDSERERNMWQLRREEELIKEEMVKRARRLLSQEKDCTKNINRALALAETLRERQAQVDFKGKLQEKELERELEYAESVQRDARLYRQEEAEKSLVTSAARSKLKVEKETMFREAQEAKLRAKLQEKEEGQKELKRLKKEMELQEREEEEQRKKDRELAVKNIEENVRMKEEYKRKVKLEEEEQETRIRIISQTRSRINQERKRREKQAQEASNLRRDKLAQKVAADVVDSREQENRSIEAAQAKQIALETERAEADKERAERNKREAIESYQVHLEEERNDKRRQYQINQWNLMQRLKKDEANIEFDSDLIRQRREVVRQCRIHWNQQKKERLEKEAREIEDDVAAINRANEIWAQEDQACLCYARQLIEESQRVGRPVYPLLVAVKNFETAMGVRPKKPLSATWKSNVPIFNAAVEEEAARREKTKPRVRLTCACIPRDGVH